MAEEAYLLFTWRESIDLMPRLFIYFVLIYWPIDIDTQELHFLVCATTVLFRKFYVKFDETSVIENVEKIIFSL